MMDQSQVQSIHTYTIEENDHHISRRRLTEIERQIDGQFCLTISSYLCFNIFTRRNEFDSLIQTFSFKYYGHPFIHSFIQTTIHSFIHPSYHASFHCCIYIYIHIYLSNNILILLFRCGLHHYCRVCNTQLNSCKQTRYCITILYTDIRNIQDQGLQR